MCQQPAPLQILYMFIYTHKWELMKSVGATDGSNLSLLLFMMEAMMGLDNSAMKLNQVITLHSFILVMVHFFGFCWNGYTSSFGGFPWNMDTARFLWFLLEWVQPVFVGFYWNRDTANFGGFYWNRCTASFL